MNDPLMTDIGKEIVVAVITSVVSIMGHRIMKIAKDINAFFEKQRCHDERLAALEAKLGLTCNDTCKEGECNEHHPK